MSSESVGTSSDKMKSLIRTRSRSSAQAESLTTELYTHSTPRSEEPETHHKDSEISNGSPDSRMDRRRKSDRAIGIHTLNQGYQNSNTPTKPMVKPGSLSSDYFSGVKIESSLALTPTRTVSAASTPSASSEGWDPPETPFHENICKSGIEVFTPFTPFTPETPETNYKESGAGTPSPLARKLVLDGVVKGPTIFDKKEARIADTNDDDEVKRIKSSSDEDDLQSGPKRKLFRSLTDQMNTIQAKNTLPTEEVYNHKPEIDFISTTPGSLPPRRQSRHKSGQTYTKNDVECSVKAEVKAKKTTSRSRKSSKESDLCLEYILPSELHARLQEKSNYCVASEVKPPHKRCPAKAKGILQDIDEPLGFIQKYIKEANYIDVFEQLRILVEGVTCGRHRNVAKKRIEKWEPSISNPSEMSPDKLAQLRTWLESILGTALSENAPDVRNDDVLVDEKPERMVSSTTIQPTIKQTVTAASIPVLRPHTFQPFQAKWSKGLDVSTALTEVISKVLKPTDKKSGFIYIFWEVGMFGSVKIGRTEDLARRLKEWNNQCQRQFDYHPATKSGLVDMIPHVSRIERLIHIELKEYRRQTTCEECGQIHREWFDIQEKHFVDVFQKWREWIMQAPYGLDATSGEWRIRPEMLHTLEQVCEPIAVDVKPSLQRPKIKTKKRVSGRRSIY